MAWISQSFVYGLGHGHRPILFFLAFDASAFVLYVGALRSVSNCKKTVRDRSKSSIVRGSKSGGRNRGSWIPGRARPCSLARNDGRGGGVIPAKAGIQETS